MARRLRLSLDSFELVHAFTIARGSKRDAVVVVAAISEGNCTGQGECVPYARYGETTASVLDIIESIRPQIEAGMTRLELQTLLPAGAARNAVDCALWDLESKLAQQPVAVSIGCHAAKPLETTFTISLDTPDAMAKAARAAHDRTLLKVKVGGADHLDAERMHAVRRAHPTARLILDANEGWTAESIRENMLAAASIGAALVEQPLPVGGDEVLSKIPHPVPICADESLHHRDDLRALVGRYDFVNIKLDKTGGLTEALALLGDARKMGFGVMIGCMVSTSLAMAPAVLLGQEANIIDLDGPLLLRTDRKGGLRYNGCFVSPPDPDFWG